jgi:hypothetical protein
MPLPTSAIAVHGDARRCDLLASAERVSPLILRSQACRRSSRSQVGLARRAAGTVLARAGLRLQGGAAAVPRPLRPPAE